MDFSAGLEKIHFTNHFKTTRSHSTSQQVMRQDYSILDPGGIEEGRPSLAPKVKCRLKTECRARKLGSPVSPCGWDRVRKGKERKEKSLSHV